MNLRDMEIFFAVADELHFGRAAASLRLNQASVSEAVARLERVMGERLFFRTTRRVSITEFGYRVLETTRPAYSALYEAYGKAVADGHHRGEIRLGHTPELGQALLPGLVQLSAAPGPVAPAPWRPITMHTREQIVALQSGAIDVGLCWEPSVSDQMSKVVLVASPLVAIMREDDPLAQDSSPIDLADMADRQMLVSPRADNPTAFARLKHGFTRAGFDPDTVIEVSHYDIVSVYVAQGYGIGIHPVFAAHLNRVPGLVFRRITGEGLDLNVCAIVMSSPRTPQVSTLLDALRAVCTEVIAAA
ncbi:MULTISPECIES: LysR family transcriptional regulator [Streptomyces]|uniref:LysR family transcriptional regulator n=1 Tax=Streptomyces arboris TaxID=2600619 RepID=A0A5N5ERX2_9ACTN|nr:MULTISPECIES: LysR family transcriptional regulator [Streptomyces]KAB2592591.1 LysR family transcriptional regulator [Streptomyces arboris]